MLFHANVQHVRLFSSSLLELGALFQQYPVLGLPINRAVRTSLLSSSQL